MSYIEVFEFNVRTDNADALRHSCQAFATAARKIEGLESMEFLFAKDDPTVVWQQIQWKDEGAVSAGNKRFWGLPEMGLFSIFTTKPPVRIREFIKA